MSKRVLFQKLAQVKKASRELALSTAKKRNMALLGIASALQKNQADILEANKKDLENVETEDPLRDRLLLTKERLKNIISDIKTVAKLSDPLNLILEQRTLKNGLRIKKITVPFGVISVIYESRPNVTVDVVSICLKAGSAIVLKGGEEARYSNQVLVRIMKEALKKTGFSEDLILNIGHGERQLVKHLLSAKDFIDLIIPRGGPGLINFVRVHAEIPVIETGAGVCHVYVDEDADINMAGKIVYNAKVSRPAVCNTLDTLLVHKKVAHSLAFELASLLELKQVEIFADSSNYQIWEKLKYPFLKRALKKDFDREFLSLKMAIKTVNNIDEALEHINRHSTKHSEAIITESREKAKKFLETADAACVYHNVSIRFTDGSQFGLGGEIGISTQKLHARGPMSIREMTTYKWVIEGSGQVRT